MINEMRRPCVIIHPVVVNDGKPFEALQMDLSFHISDLDIYISDYDDAKNDFNFHQSFRFNTLKELQDAKYSIQWQLAQALKRPIKVTQAVLDAINKVPEASFWYVEGSVNVRLKWDETLKTFTVNGQTLSITDYIQADCPLALQVLLQFNTEGELFDA